jgi:hypothetical protein
MKTIVCDQNCSKYLFADDKQLNITADHIEVGDPANLDFIIGDLNANNSTLIEGVTEPDDWYGCKYNYVDGAWSYVLTGLIHVWKKKQRSKGAVL